MESYKTFQIYIDRFSAENDLSFDIQDHIKFLKFSEYQSFVKTNKFVVFEDWWIRKPDVIKAKILSIFGLSKRIHGRECEVRKISKPDADKFMNEYHILDSAGSKVKYGLFYKDDLVSAAAFAAQRQFRKGQRSVELVRFCHKNSLMVTGGIDKLIKAYIKEYKPDEIMTYVDLDWGNGQAFKKLGFEEKEVKEPMLFFVNTKTGLRIPNRYFKDQKNISEYVTIKNAGSLKLVKYV